VTAVPQEWDEKSLAAIPLRMTFFGKAARPRMLPRRDLTSSRPFVNFLLTSFLLTSGRGERRLSPQVFLQD
jgi:hypothetical protein